MCCKGGGGYISDFYYEQHVFKFYVTIHWDYPKNSYVITFCTIRQVIFI